MKYAQGDDLDLTLFLTTTLFYSHPYLTEEFRDAPVTALLVVDWDVELQFTDLNYVRDVPTYLCLLCWLSLPCLGSTMTRRHKETRIGYFSIPFIAAAASSLISPPFPPCNRN
jgi:hypothetical protein